MFFRDPRIFFSVSLPAMLFMCISGYMMVDSLSERLKKAQLELASKNDTASAFMVVRHQKDLDVVEWRLKKPSSSYRQPSDSSTNSIIDVLLFSPSGD